MSLQGDLRKKQLRFSNGMRGRFLGKDEPRVVIVSAKEWVGRVLDDLLVERELLVNGIYADIVSWQDELIDYRNYDVILIGSMWGYQDRLDDFRRWMERVEKSGAVVMNPISVIRDNCDKVKQFRLIKGAGLPVIKTKVIKVGELADFKVPEEEYVIKPAISGGGENTFLIRGREDYEKKYKTLEKVNSRVELLVQPYAREITDGEVGVVMIGGKIMNAVRRFPGVLAGEFRVELVDKVPAELKELAKKAWGLYPGISYMRVDTVKTDEGYVIMEVEAFEPQLYYYLQGKEGRAKMLSAMRDEVTSAMRDEVTENGLHQEI